MAQQPTPGIFLLQDKLQFEQKAWERGCGSVAGVDEVGRGPLAGPVVAACVLLDRDLFDNAIPEYFESIDDSKKVSPAKREKLSALLRAQPGLEIAVGVVDSDIIDTINILQATHLAMQKAVAGLSAPPYHLLVDGHQKVSSISIEQTAIIGGDGLSWAIGAASIVAKVYRDALMDQYDREYPQYGFARHKGYGTRAHLNSLRQYGPCPIHRKSFAPVTLAL